MNNEIPDNWYETFFSGINCEMWEKAATQEWTDREVSFLIDVLNPGNGASLLDMPCGQGRHSLTLARQGFRMTAVDISEEFLASLTEKAGKEQLTIDIKHGNLLTMPLTGAFDAVITLGNSFGYFDFKGMNVFVQKVSSVLTPGGRWLINSGLMAESFLAKFIREKRYELPGLTMDIHNDYDVWNSCLLTSLTYTKNNMQETHRFKHYVHTVEGVVRLLASHGLHTIALYGSTEKTSYALGDDQVYLVAEKTGND